MHRFTGGTHSVITEAGKFRESIQPGLNMDFKKYTSQNWTRFGLSECQFIYILLLILLKSFHLLYWPNRWNTAAILCMSLFLSFICNFPYANTFVITLVFGYLDAASHFALYLDIRAFISRTSWKVKAATKLFWELLISLLIRNHSSSKTHFFIETDSTKKAYAETLSRTVWVMLIKDLWMSLQTA